MNTTLVLLPQPRQLTRDAGIYVLTSELPIVLNPAPELHSVAERLRAVLRAVAPGPWPLSAFAGPMAAVRIYIDPAGIVHAQGYRLTISAAGVTITAHDAPGALYAVCTLAQIIEQCGVQLPYLTINDWPDFPVRGVMLDISRDKVPTQATLLALVELLAGWKINQLQLYTEHTFAYTQHPEVWADASPMTGDDILALDAYCRARFIELVPNQNTFGHMERWLKHPRYAALAETHAEFDTPWGMRLQGPFSLCPGDPGSMVLVRSLLDELLPHFSSRQVNIGCDETVDVGQGRSRDDVTRRGAGSVYLDFLKQVLEAAQERGHTPQFWGDIIMQHPELVPALPTGVIALEWGYEASHPFAEHGARFAASGIPFYVCPGTSAWCSIAGRTDNALGNLRAAAEHGLQHGAIGYLNTDWGDRGHWQALPVSYVGFAAGAAYSWAFQANQSLNIPAALDRFVFGDTAGIAGRVLYDLGNIYRALGFEPPNSSALFWAMQRSVAELQAGPSVPPAAFAHALEAIDEVTATLPQAQLHGVDAALHMRELAQTVRLLQHACNRGLYAHSPSPAQAQALADDLEAIIPEYRALWLARNRPGGLNDSVARFEQALNDYRADEAV